MVGESARIPPLWPGFNSRTRRNTLVELVVGSRSCSEGVFSGSSGFSNIDYQVFIFFQAELVTLNRLRKSHIDLKREVFVEMKQVHMHRLVNWNTNLTPGRGIFCWHNGRIQWTDGDNDLALAPTYNSVVVESVRADCPQQTNNTNNKQHKPQQNSL